MENYLHIIKVPQGYKLEAYYNGKKYVHRFMWYSLKEAEKLFRKTYGLIGKHLEKSFYISKELCY